MKSVLKPKLRESYKFSAKVSSEVHSGIDEVNSLISSSKAGVMFDTDGIVEEALMKAIKQARKELSHR